MNHTCRLWRQLQTRICATWRSETCPAWMMNLPNPLPRAQLVPNPVFPPTPVVPARFSVRPETEDATIAGDG